MFLVLFCVALAVVVNAAADGVLLNEKGRERICGASGATQWPSRLFRLAPLQRPTPKITSLCRLVSISSVFSRRRRHWLLLLLLHLPRHRQKQLLFSGTSSDFSLKTTLFESAARSP